MKSLLILALLCCYPAHNDPPAPYRLRGVVLDAVTNTPIANVHVQVIGTASSDTGESGIFTIYLYQPPGTGTTVLAHRSGYIAERFEYLLPTNPDQHPLEIRLRKPQIPARQFPKDTVAPMVDSKQLQRLKEEIEKGIIQKNNDDRIYDYVDEVAAEGENLANAWTEILHEVTEGALRSTEDLLRILKRYNISISAHTTPLARLRAFYTHLRQALGGKLSDNWIRELGASIQRVANARELTREGLNRLIDETNKEDVFLAAGNHVQDLKNLAGLVEVLQREAASLSVLATTIRIANKPTK